MATCLFCGRADAEVSVEHVIPRWVRRALAIQGGVRMSTSDGPAQAKEPVGRMPDLNVTLEGAICAPCNTGWLSQLEKRAARILKPMIVSAEPVMLSAGDQALLSLWAVKTVLLLELALRQMHEGRRMVEGYRATEQELAWLWAYRRPPDRAMVWLACWDCEREVPLNYEPSGAEVPSADGTSVAGHMTTFSIGFVAFQVFTVDFVAAGVHGAVVWNDRPPLQLRAALPRIWPQPDRAIPDLSWPPETFRRDEWRRLVTWDWELRRGVEPLPPRAASG